MRLIIGAAVGWLASILIETRSRVALLANILVGVAGALVGVVIADTLGVGTYREVGGWVVPVLGAALPLAVLQALGVLRRVAISRLASRRIRRNVRSVGLSRYRLAREARKD